LVKSLNVVKVVEYLQSIRLLCRKHRLKVLYQFLNMVIVGRLFQFYYQSLVLSGIDTLSERQQSIEAGYTHQQNLVEVVIVSIAHCKSRSLISYPNWSSAVVIISLLRITRESLHQNRLIEVHLIYEGLISNVFSTSYRLRASRRVELFSKRES
jgi:hypothetical protein